MKAGEVGKMRAALRQPPPTPDPSDGKASG